MTIVPALIPRSTEHLTETLRMITSWSREVQIDVVDGVFVPYTSWPYGTDEHISLLAEYATNLTIEVDLMIEAPERVLSEYLAAGVQRVVVHLESVHDLASIVALKRLYPFLLGFSIGNETPLATLESVIGYADYVQLMGISSIGTQGQPFDVRVISRVRELIAAHQGTLPISVDGSVNADTIPFLKNVGVLRGVVGSAILSAENPAHAYSVLTQMASE